MIVTWRCRACRALETADIEGGDLATVADELADAHVCRKSRVAVDKTSTNERR